MLLHVVRFIVEFRRYFVRLTEICHAGRGERGRAIKEVAILTVTMIAVLAVVVRGMGTGAAAVDGRVLELRRFSSVGSRASLAGDFRRSDEHLTPL
jgi:hypothetical protein